MPINSDYEFYSEDLDKIIGIVNHYPCVMDDVVRLTYLMRHVMEIYSCTGEDAIQFIAKGVGFLMTSSQVP